ncbi:MAG: FHA domain-containing protein [bacterium]
MTFFRSIYYFGVTGCLAGLLGWFTSCWIVDLSFSPLITAVAVGCLVGIFIGSFVCALERIMDSGITTCLGDFLLGALTGIIGGSLGGVVFFYLYEATKDTIPYFGRMFGWSTLGVLVSIAEAIRWRSMRRALNGLLGGAIGGLIGGFIHHFLGTIFGPTVSMAWGITILGASIASGVSFACILGSDAYLQGVEGNKSSKYGEQYKKSLYRDARNIIGSGDPGRFSSKANIQIVGDELIDSLHATISWEGRQFFISPYELPNQGEETYVNGHKIDRKQQLQHGDLICLGSSCFRFLKVRSSSGDSSNLPPREQIRR